MTDWRTLPAGPELDACILERVFGWERIEGNNWRAPSKVLTTGYVSIPAYTPSPSLSQTWEGAGQVVEAMEWRGWYLTLRRYAYHEPPPDGAWDACFVRTNDDLEEPLYSADTAPLAISRAALAALSPD